MKQVFHFIHTSIWVVFFVTVYVLFHDNSFLFIL